MQLELHLGCIVTYMLEDVKRKKQAEERDKAQKENVKSRKLKRGECEGGLSGDK